MKVLKNIRDFFIYALLICGILTLSLYLISLITENIYIIIFGGFIVTIFLTMKIENIYSKQKCKHLKQDN